MSVVTKAVTQILIGFQKPLGKLIHTNQNYKKQIYT